MTVVENNSDNIKKNKKNSIEHLLVFLAGVYSNSKCKNQLIFFRVTKIQIPIFLVSIKVEYSSVIDINVICNLKFILKLFFYYFKK